MHIIGGMNTLPIYRETVIEVNLDRIAYNMEQIRAMVGKDVKIAAVVKANGYGHGAVGIAPAIMEHGGDLLCVATLTEAIELKETYPEYPVLIMGLTPKEGFPAVLDYNILQTIDTLDQAKALASLARKRGAAAGIHIKYDTGFHRIGFPDNPESYRAIEEISRMEGLKIEGIFSHLVLLDDESNRRQYEAFCRAVKALRERGVVLPCCHLADSIASVDYPEYRMDMIRAGAIIYGLKGFHKGRLDVRQALTFKTKINHITEIKAGEGVSYDFMWRTERDTRIGTLPFGYADGYPRSLSNLGTASLHGKPAPVIGRVSMDQIVVDASAIPEAAAGDEAVLLGVAPADGFAQAAAKAGTISYELLCAVARRVPRVYLRGGKVVEVLDYLNEE